MRYEINYKYLIVAAIFSSVALGVIFTPVVESQSQEIQLGPGKSKTVSLPTASAISLDARISYSRPAGARQVLEVSVNGTVVNSPLLNKGKSFNYKDGRTFDYKYGNAWVIFYSADFSANNTSAGGGYQVLTDPGQAYHYRWDISALAGNSETMDVTIKNVGPTYPFIVLLESGVGNIVKKTEDFPIKELGNCTSESNCKQFCAESGNILACTNYGEKRGLVSSEDAAKAREFADVLRGEGPGGCKDQKGCESYCNGVSNLNECVSFAEKHNLIPPDQLKEAKKVLKAMSEGGKLPGGCTDKNSCESYCADISHGSECVDFAEKAGFMSEKEVAEARRVLPLIARGESPGGCKTKEQCEKYCDSESNILECVGFAEKAGFMTSEEAAMVRKTGGKGPGGCRSKESCDSYCNDSKNQESCFEFATKYDLIPPEKLKEIKEGMGRLRSGLKQMPESAVKCLNGELGDEAMGKIEDGSFMPSPKMGETIKGCMVKAMPEIKAKIESAMQFATPETKACLEKGLGSGGLDKVLAGEEMTPETGDVMRNCFESMRTEGMKQIRDGLKQMPPEIKTCVEDKFGSEFIRKVEKGEEVEVGPETGNVFQSCAHKATEIMDKALEQAPLEIRDCIKNKIGDISKIRGPQDIQEYISECTKNFVPKGIPSGAEGYMPQGVPSSNFVPKGIPSSAEGYRPSDVPSSGSSGGQIPASACESFKAAPSCGFVPESVRDICKQCKGE